MSRERALEAIQLRKTERIPKWIGVPYNAEFLERLSGIAPYLYPKEASLQAIKELNRDVF